MILTAMALSASKNQMFGGSLSSLIWLAISLWLLCLDWSVLMYALAEANGLDFSGQNMAPTKFKRGQLLCIPSQELRDMNVWGWGWNWGLKMGSRSLGWKAYFLSLTNMHPKWGCSNCSASWRSCSSKCLWGATKGLYNNTLLRRDHRMYSCVLCRRF